LGWGETTLGWGETTLGWGETTLGWGETTPSWGETTWGKTDLGRNDRNSCQTYIVVFPILIIMNRQRKIVFYLLFRVTRLEKKSR